MNTGFTLNFLAPTDTSHMKDLGLWELDFPHNPILSLRAERMGISKWTAWVYLSK